jgi:diguanylate cyclase (GGDEF)-like protein
MFNGPLPYILALVLAAVICGAAAVYAWRFRLAPLTAALTGLLVCSAIYSLGYALELNTDSLDHMLILNKVQYVGIAFIPFFWILLCARFAGRETWLRRPVLAIPFFLSLTTLVLNVTNSVHHLFYRAVSLDSSGPFPVIVLDKGVWFWIHIVYTHLALIAGTALLIRMRQKAPSRYRSQAAVLLIGAGLLWIGLFVYILGLTPHRIDTTPLAMILAGPVLAWGLLRYRFLDLVPVARDSVFAGMRDGAVVIDLQDRIVDVNAAAAEIIPGLSPAAIGTKLGDALPDQKELAALLQTTGREEASIRVGDGEGIRHYLARLSPIADRRRRLLGRALILTDVTEQVLLMRRLENLATIDELTGAYNRRHFFNVGKAEIARAWRYGHPLSIIILDLDHFKRVNDTWGHEAGDRVLQEACRIIKSRMRSIDIFGRHGGEEFAVLLPETPPDQAAAVAERLRASLADHQVKVAGDASVSITASIGVAGALRIREESIDSLIRSADAAMYKAKEAGRNCVRLAAPTA